MKVPLLDLQAQYTSIQKEMDAAVLRVLREQKGILGPEVKKLEEDIAAYCRSKYAIAVASGTDALLLSLMIMGVGGDDAVITTPYTFFATAGSIDRLGAKTLFVDISPNNFNMDPDRLTELLATQCRRDDASGAVIHKSSGKIVKAVMPVHLYGQCADMSRIMAIAKEWGLHVIEDACQAIGAEIGGQSAGTIGELGTLSFFPSKNLGGLGDGGMILTQNEDFAEMAKILRIHGSEPKYFHKFVGINSRLDTLQAALLMVKLPYLKRWTGMRQQNAEFYDKALAALSEVQTPIRMPGSSHVFNQYCLRAKNRDGLRKFLAEQGIGTEIYYPLCLHLQECFLKLGYKERDFPESEKASRETLALPIYSELTPDQKQHVVESIEKFYR